MAVQDSGNMETNVQKEKQPECMGAVLRAELIRSTIITSFKLQDQIPHYRIPKFRAKDVFEENLYAKQKGKETHNLVHFKVSSRRSEAVTEGSRRLARLQNRQSKYPPLNMFAHWILESKFFSTIIVCLILLNALVLGLQSDFSADENWLQVNGMHVYALVLDVVDYCILVLFLVEILLQWLDDFRHFWRKPWNVFDFIVTMVSVLPEIIKCFVPDAGDLAVMELLKNLRILRTFKLLPKFEHFRLILRSISKSFSTMVPIFGLLLMFAYIFAVAGVVLFEKYSRSQKEGLVFKDSFADIPSAFVSLFMVFTLDHWAALLAEMISVPEISKAVSYIYIVLWLLLASFTFHNIVMGVMAKKFQVIRDNQNVEEEQLKFITKAKEYILHRIMDSSDEVPTEGEQADGKEDPDTSVEERDWQACVQKNLTVLLDQALEEKVTWPKGKLFRYFELLELLQANLDEREKIQGNLASQLRRVKDDAIYLSSSFLSFS